MNNYFLITSHCLFMTIILLIVPGCSGNIPRSWTPTQQNDKIVWADDGSEVATVVLSFEEKRSGVFSRTTDKRHFKHQIVVQNIDGAPRTITDWRNYQNGQIFYMKQAGYFVVESLLPNGAKRFDKIALNGNEILIIETPDSEHKPCQNVATSKTPPVDSRVIPSPDGQQLAYIYSPECGKVTVEFLHANNLNLFDNQSIEIDEPMNAKWHPEGYVILVSKSHKKAWKFTPLTPPASITPPQCFSAMTTSSDVSSEGQKVYFDGDKLATKEVGSQQTFGCQ